MVQRQGTLIHISTLVFRVCIYKSDLFLFQHILDVQEVHGIHEVHLVRGPHALMDQLSKKIDLTFEHI